MIEEAILMKRRETERKSETDRDRDRGREGGGRVMRNAYYSYYHLVSNFISRTCTCGEWRIQRNPTTTSLSRNLRFPLSIFLTLILLVTWKTDWVRLSWISVTNHSNSVYI